MKSERKVIVENGVAIFPTYGRDVGEEHETTLIKISEIKSMHRQCNDCYVGSGSNPCYLQVPSDIYEKLIEAVFGIKK